MDQKRFIKDYQKFLKQNSNPLRAKKEKAYLYSDLKHYGVSVWERRKYINNYKTELHELTKKDAISLVKKFWLMPYFEEKSITIDILCAHAKKLTLADMPLVEKIMRECRGWAFLDSFIIPIMPVLITKDKKTYDYLKKWIKDDDFWVRRSALLSQLLLFRNDSGGNRDLFFQMAISQFDESWIDKLYSDKLLTKRAKFFIRKAIGWMLREMSIKNPQLVYKFLKENKSKMSGLSFREGSRRLPQTLKATL